MNLYGWNGSVTAGLTSWFGFTTDFSGNYSNAARSISATLTTTFTPCEAECTETETEQLTVSEPRIHTFLFGPQFTFPAGKVKTYTHFLVGGMNRNVAENETLSSSSELISGLGGLIASSTNLFAMGFGGGVDYPVRRQMSWRVGADYLTSTGTAQNHVRVVTGLVWILGK